MRVLQIIDSMQLGGAEMLLHDLLPLFRQRGIESDIAVLRLSGSRLEKELEQQGFRVFAPVDAGIYSPRQVLGLRRAMRGYDLIHVHLFPAQLWAGIAYRMSGSRVPLITTEHSTLNDRRHTGFRTFDRFMFSPYRHVVCISKATEEAFTAWQPQWKGRVSVVPNGVAVERLARAAPLDKREILGTDASLVLTIGRFTPEKDHASVVRALALLEGVHLAIVGAGTMRHEVEQLAGSLGIADRVHFLGRREDVPSLMRAADVYVQSSVFEGFGLAALEAMTAGVPVVASDVPGLGELVRGAGKLFRVGDHQQLAEEISTILKHPELGEQLISAGRKRAQEYSIEATAAAYAELYRSLLGDRARNGGAAGQGPKETRCVSL